MSYIGDDFSIKCLGIFQRKNSKISYFNTLGK